jgi:hypothetical protein
MTEKVYLKSVFAYREDTLANWEEKNPVLHRGEPAIVRDGEDGNWLKIGDGTTPFNSLPWKTGPKGEDAVFTDEVKDELCNRIMANFTDVSEVGV